MGNFSLNPIYIFIAIVLSAQYSLANQCTTLFPENIPVSGYNEQIRHFDASRGQLFKLQLEYENKKAASDILQVHGKIAESKKLAPDLKQLTENINAKQNDVNDIKDNLRDYIFPEIEKLEDQIIRIHREYSDIQSGKTHLFALNASQEVVVTSLLNSLVNESNIIESRIQKLEMDLKILDN